MSDASIPVDLRNPGQVFACLGFLEAADILLGDAEGGFDWRDKAAVKFRLRATGDENPVAEVLAFLATAESRWFSPAPEIRERDGGITVVQEGISSSRDPKPSDLPGILLGEHRGTEQVIHFGFWADGSTRFSITFKKSTNGASSYIRLMNALNGMRALDIDRSASDPFEQQAKTDSLFRLDPRGSVDPINAGTSPDRLRKGGIKMRVTTYPICEALAILGMEHARSQRDGPMQFRYSVWSRLKSESHDVNKAPVFLSPVLARAAINGSLTFLETRHFSVEHEEVKKGGDRKMTNIIEELHS